MLHEPLNQYFTDVGDSASSNICHGNLLQKVYTCICQFTASDVKTVLLSMRGNSPWQCLWQLTASAHSFKFSPGPKLWSVGAPCVTGLQTPIKQ